jgi:hypothetical protein
LPKIRSRDNPQIYSVWCQPVAHNQEQRQPPNLFSTMSTSSPQSGAETTTKSIQYDVNQ